MDDCCEREPLFTFGVIADIQYADIDDGLNFTQTRRRFYRNSLQLLREARETWSQSATRPNFILQLGDIIDGFNKDYGASSAALDRVLEEFNLDSMEVHHVWGNHELYNFTRSELLHSRLNSAVLADRSSSGTRAGGDIYAYSFSPFPGFTFVVLDAYDVSLLGVEEDSSRYHSALTLIKLHNNNEDLNCPPGHLPVHPCSTTPICLAWNFDELLSIIQRHSSVVCFIAGHDHDGGYYLDESTGVHHLTLEAVIETPPGNNAFGTVSVYEDRMVLKGTGRIPDVEVLFP
ncbi:manganese-dependent ADP-ribose/CDP-alcohol diphosphatase isoform X2 [Dunckerocampus dactyliophorus]|uniref:manganese-dependent ADP-ribose/CDP-alcohol diphosphatase isoform X2 n=1 Tax=Dunckerocampus dactyliophorus TaxID=161453 RepID=UPI002405DA1F|nr:manganese-dependent ADP-ribose/CDP-alcohol diphosphatase isoform X2 [Dunckerocampus dactyliophorus]